MEKNFREKHPLLLRLTHWLNVPLLALMVWSGILIYWADPAFLPVPDAVGPFQIHHRLAEGMAWHFTVMWPFVINGLLYFAFLFFSHGWRELLPRRETLKSALQYALFDLKLSRHEPAWSGKFNPAQRLAYSGAILLAVLGVLSGLAIYKPVQLGLLKFLLGGYRSARFLHFVCMSGLCLFVAVHLIQVARAGWNNFRSMVAGYEME